MTINPVGLYVHIPFCQKKCLYCDFYSFSADEQTREVYVKELLKRFDEYSEKYGCKADTLYIGGGTPSLLSPSQIERLVKKAKDLFLTDDAEITVEANPHSSLPEFLRAAAFAGVNRMSFGLQSSNEKELAFLGRSSTPKELENAVKSAYSAGIENVSADVMLGLQNQTKQSLGETVDFALSLGVKHVSAYILKLEENTPLYKMRKSLSLPDDDETAELYLYLCDKLTSNNTLQYEISNFAVRGYESRHNLKYWRDEEYLGIGASAHSFMNGKRFYFPRDIKAFLGGCSPVDDGEGGGEEEYIMLKLRLSEGISFSEFEKRFSHPFDEIKKEKARFLKTKGLVDIDESHISLTRAGFLVSNSLICEFI
ncbi:MAG: radical SAM family heme chaperone HemW [Ruminococcaceae bacterium]|jgi:oxygen-independent coproporphyrinogen-3 oxidase|nr:radical SAM family heme chaperone HemW [Oscillospiraceae bacterium]